ncbi:MAG: ComEA family DNA-binding protein [Bacteroidota bacterium]
MLFRKLRWLVRSYLSLTYRERRGMQFLALLMLLQTGGLLAYKVYWLNTPYQPVDPGIRQLMLSDSIAEVNESRLMAASRQPRVLPMPFPFDPNNMDLDEWMRLGFSEKQSQSLLNYVDKGGRFRTKEDLAKMFVVDSAMYQHLEPYINIQNQEKAPNKMPETKRQLTVEINSADTVLLCKLNGIGLGRARMILRYRESLGGFVDINQLLEVYSVDTVVMEQIRPYLQLNPALVRALDINADTIKHPYLNRKVAQSVINYRKQHGDFKSLSDLEKVVLLDASTIRKLAPYLRFE